MFYFLFSIGFLTLSDFKRLIKRPGKYRYFFKSMDKDFGCVREEVSLNMFSLLTENSCRLLRILDIEMKYLFKGNKKDTRKTSR